MNGDGQKEVQGRHPHHCCCAALLHPQCSPRLCTENPHFEDAGQEGVASQLGDHLEVGARQLLLAAPQPLEPAARGG